MQRLSLISTANVEKARRVDFFQVAPKWEDVRPKSNEKKMKRDASRIERDNAASIDEPLSKRSKRSEETPSWDPLLNHALVDVWTMVAAHVDPTKGILICSKKGFEWKEEFASMLAVSKFIRSIFFDSISIANVELGLEEPSEFSLSSYFKNLKRLRHLGCVVKNPKSNLGPIGNELSSTMVFTQFGTLQGIDFDLGKVDDRFAHLRELTSLCTSRLEGTNILAGNSRTLKSVYIQSWALGDFSFSTFRCLTALSLVGVSCARPPGPREGPFPMHGKISLPRSLEHLTLVNLNYRYLSSVKASFPYLSKDNIWSLSFDPSEVPNLKKLTLCTSVAKEMLFDSSSCGFDLDSNCMGYSYASGGRTYHELCDHPSSSPDSAGRSCSCFGGFCKNTFMPSLKKITIRKRRQKDPYFLSVPVVDKISVRTSKGKSPKTSCYFYMRDSYDENGIRSEYAVQVNKSWNSNGDVRKAGVTVLRLLNSRKEMNEVFWTGPSFFTEWMKTGVIRDDEYDDKNPCKASLTFAFKDEETGGDETTLSNSKEREEENRQIAFQRTGEIEFQAENEI